METLNTFENRIKTIERRLDGMETKTHKHESTLDIIKSRLGI